MRFFCVLETENIAGGWHTDHRALWHFRTELTAEKQACEVFMWTRDRVVSFLALHIFIAVSLIPSFIVKFCFLSCFRGLCFYRPSVFLASCYCLSLCLSPFPPFILSHFFLHFHYLFYHFTSTFSVHFSSLLLYFLFYFFQSSFILTFLSFFHHTHSCDGQWLILHTYEYL